MRCGRSFRVGWTRTALGLLLPLLVPALAGGVASELASVPGDSVCASRSDLAGACFELRGRLSFWNGAPSARIWPVGTRRLLGVHADVLPPALAAQSRGFDSELWAHYTVCPFTPSRPGHMQFICIEAWRDLTVRQRPR
jgi:hypothetical protein